MNKVYLIKTEIRPLVGSQLLKEHPNAEGAFVNVIVPAKNKIEAEKKAKNALLEDDYETIKIEEAVDFAQIEMDDEDEAIVYKAMAWDAMIDGIIGYGAFHVWPDDTK